MNFIIKFVAIQFFVICCFSGKCPKLKNSRLSTKVIPSNYELNVNLNLNQLIFNSSVLVSIQVKKKTNEITIHSKDLQVTSVKLINKAVEIVAKEITYCEEEETVSFLFSRFIRGQWKLAINFNGKLSTSKAKGFYAMRRSNGSDLRYSIATEFDPNDARRAFPCFDEPSFKATYSISVVAPKDRTVVSNMPVVHITQASENENKFVFQKSPRMSTYLVCIVVGDYEFVEQQSMDGRIPVRVYTPIGRRYEGTFVLDVVIRSLDFLQNFLGVEYSLPKLDVITVRDLYISGMENWGLITTREHVLVNEETPISVKQRVAFLIAHEVSHQWFGNLVTLHWWTHNWLNEGFAAFFENLITHNLFKQWNYWRLFLSDLYSSALETDSLHSSHPITLKYLDVKETHGIAFDNIIYAKGGSIIRMLYEWIGEKDFRLGLKTYLNFFKYANAKTDDVLEKFDSASNKSVKEVMNAWFRKKGYPVLSVIIGNFKCNNGVKQQKFSFDGYNNNEESKILWNIPILYSSKNKTHYFIMKRRESRMLSKCISDWNVGSLGFYRTEYQDHEYKKLFTQESIGKINPEQRFSLQNDYFAFAKAGRKSTADYLEYLKLYTNDDQLFIWQSIDKSISEINSMASFANCSKNMNEYNRRLFGPIFKNLNNTENNDDLNILLKVLVYKRLGFSGDEQIVSDAFKQFNKLYSNNKILDSNFRSVIFQIVALNASDDVYNKFFELYKRNIDNAIIKNELSSAFGFSSNRAQLEKALHFSLSNDVTIFDSATIISSIGGSFNGLAWDFFVKNFEIYKIRFEQEPYIIKAIVSGLNSNRTSEVKQFFKLNEFKGIESALLMSLEMVENKEKWFKKDALKVCEYLNTQ